MDDSITSIQIKKVTWEELNKRRKCGETFDFIITKMLLKEPEIKPLKQNNSQGTDKKGRN